MENTAAVAAIANSEDLVRKGFLKEGETRLPEDAIHLAAPMRARLFDRQAGE